MVLCCVPSCGSESNSCESTVTFHEFPSNSVLAERWVKQINSVRKSNLKTPWSPNGETVICSKHFLQTDFRDDTDTLKPLSLPTVFGHKYIGFNQSNDEGPKSRNSDVKKSPMIVKVNRPIESNVQVPSLDVGSQKNTASKDVPFTTPKSSNITQIFLPSTKSARKEILDSKTPVASKLTTILAGEGNSVLKSLQQGSMKVSSGHSVFLQTKDVQSASLKVPISPLKNSPPKNKKKTAPENNLIEIGPNTFLKINPEIIKVNKKHTPSGNTVLQFIMSQKMANRGAAEMLPKLIESVTNAGSGSMIVQNSMESPQKSPIDDNYKKDPVVEHVVGHLVDTHVCKDSCEKINEDELSCDDMVLDDAELTGNGMEVDDPLNSSLEVPTERDTAEGIGKSDKSTTSVLNKAPVLFTTNVPLSHCLMDKPKYLSQLRQKSRQIASLKFKLTSLNKKIEDLEDKCIVQERQLSYTFIKRLKAIRKAASNGDPCATYILEQIRCYSGKTKMRWSDSTLAQCAVWCRKAPYAYEYFKKADFFKLPCLGTVKRFMKKHPELKLQNKPNSVNPDDSSSSDFDFDDSDSGNEEPENNDQERIESTSASDTALTNASLIINPSISQSVMTSVSSHGSIPSTSVQDMIIPQVVSSVSLTDEASKDKPEKLIEMSSFPVTMDGSSNLEVQEIMLPSGEVVQCYSSTLCNGDTNNHYYIIPNVGEQAANVDQEYNVVHSGEPLPVILQNLDNAQLPLQQDQLIFITNSTDQVECSESEVITT